MRRNLFSLIAILLFVFCAEPSKSQEGGDLVARAVAEGDAFLKQKNFEKALAAYHKADKLSHHTSAACFLGMFRVERQLGNLSAALDDAKQAVKAAGDNKGLAAQAHLLRSTLLARMASKPNDKKLKEAEAELREVLALKPNLAIAHLNLGKILIRQERDDEGIPELKSYLAMPGTDPKLALEARRIIANPIRGREPFAPDFSFSSLEGESLSNAALRGKVVLFDFWGTWCPPCRESIPSLLNINKKYRDRPFQIVGVSSDSNEQVWKRFIAANHMNWPEFLDSSDVVRGAFEINSYPTLVVLDRDGVITYSQSGWNYDLQSELEDAINKALKRPSNPAALAAQAASLPEEPAPKPQADANPAGTETLAPMAPDRGTSAQGGVVSGNLYRNDDLGFSYQPPPNWVAASPDIIQAATEKAQADMRAKFLEQHPEQQASVRINFPKIIFYASKSGQGDGQRLNFPCVRISVLPSTGPSFTLDAVKARAEKMEPPGVTLVRDPEEYTLNGQEFLRMDLVNSNGTPRIWVSRTVTIMHSQLVVAELFVTDQQELESLGKNATLKLLEVGTPPPESVTMASTEGAQELPNPKGIVATPGGDRSGGAATPAKGGPPSYLADMRQGEAFQRTGNVDGAIAMFRQAIHSQPNDAKCHRLLADTLAQKGDRAAAIVEYQEAVRLEPENPEYHFMLGAQLEARGASAAYARDDFKSQTGSSQPGHLALPKTAQTDYDAALEQYALAHQLAPQTPAYNEAYERMKSRLKRE